MKDIYLEFVDIVIDNCDIWGLKVCVFCCFFWLCFVYFFWFVLDFFFYLLILYYYEFFFFFVHILVCVFFYWHVVCLWVLGWLGCVYWGLSFLFYFLRFGVE